MKRISLLFIIMAAVVLTAAAQITTTKLTVYKDFQPSIIQLKDGRLIKQNLTNIFLKNSSLLYMQGTNAMEANMDNIISVKFDDKTYVKVDTILAYVVDSIGNDVLYCATVIDIDAYQNQLRTNNIVSNFSWGAGGTIQTSSMNLNTEEDYKFPLVDLYFYRINGQFVKCHERNLQYILNKEKKRIVRTFVTMDDFSWTEKESLMKLLKALQ